MTATSAFWRRASFGLLVVAELAAGIAVTAVITSVPASAQFFFDERYPFLDPRPRRRGGGFDPNQSDERPPDFSRAPAAMPRKPDAGQITTKILVLGDSMADWLAYGLDEALAETPEIGVIRKHKSFSGLIRYEAQIGNAGMVAGRARIDRSRKAASRHHDDRRAGPSGDAREDRAQARSQAGRCKARRSESRRTKARRGEARRKTGRAKPAARRNRTRINPRRSRRKKHEKPQDPADDEQQPNIAAAEPQRGARRDRRRCTNITPRNGKSFTTSASKRRSRR